MKVYLLVCEEESAFVDHIFSFAESFTSLEKTQIYAKSHSDFILGYKADMEWIQSKDKDSWRVETGSRVYTIWEKEIDRVFDE